MDFEGSKIDASHRALTDFQWMHCCSDTEADSERCHCSFDAAVDASDSRKDAEQRFSGLDFLFAFQLSQHRTQLDCTMNERLPSL